MTEALFLTNVFTFGLKLSTQRTRPDGSDDLSFPSAHAASPFALASVIEVFYGPVYGIPSYALASAIALSRIDRNKHYLTDTMTGALLGTLVGLGTARFHKERVAGFFVVPETTVDRLGIRIHHRF